MVSPIKQLNPQIVESKQSESFNDKLKEILKSKGLFTEPAVSFEKQTQLNRDLDNMISSDRFNQLTRNVIEIIADSYKSVDSRTQKLTLNGIDLDYKKDLSNSLYSHYENDATIILGIHGVNDFKLTGLAVTQIINPDIANEGIQMFCNKIKSIRNNSKQIYLFSHSLGFWLTASCKESLALPFIKGLSISGFAPNSTSPQIKNLGKSRVFKKILFETDWLASRILEVQELHNVLILRPYSAFTRLNGHSTKSYKTNIDQLNKARVRFIP